VTHDWDALARGTLAVYAANARAFNQTRNKTLFEKQWLDRFLAMLPARSHILDAGCGTGDPIARYLMERGHTVTGIDGAPAMIAEAQAAFPRGDWRVMDLRQITLPGPYDGVLGWNSVFHLTQAEQRTVIPHLIRLARPGGPLMITIGHGNGTATGTIAGHTVYHASLSPREYRALLDENGCDTVDLVIEDPRCNGHSVLLGRRRSSAQTKSPDA